MDYRYLIAFISVGIGVLFFSFWFLSALLSKIKSNSSKKEFEKNEEKRVLESANKVKQEKEKSQRQVRELKSKNNSFKKQKTIVKTIVKKVPIESANENNINEQEIHFYEGEDSENVVTAKISKETGKMILIRYKKSFLARLNLTEDVNKQYYSTIKNKLLSYKKIKSRISWNYDAFNFGRIQAAKVNVRGKTVFVYLPLNPSDYVDSKYSFKDCSEIKKYESLPFRLKVKSDRGLKNAFELIELVMSNFQTELNNKFVEENYVEVNRGFSKLLEEGLIKEVIDENTFENLTEINKEFLDSNKIVSVNLEDIKNVTINQQLYEEIIETIVIRGYGKKDIINVDVISNNFTDGEIVNLESLISKKLISKKSSSVKCLARGTLNKKLVFELDGYSKDAIKMIVVTGGTIR